MVTQFLSERRRHEPTAGAESLMPVGAADGEPLNVVGVRPGIPRVPSGLESGRSHGVAERTACRLETFEFAMRGGDDS
jgi:hypothetical protein